MPRLCLLAAILLQIVAASAAEPVDTVELIERYRRDSDELQSFYSVSTSRQRRERLDRHDEEWLNRLESIDGSSLDVAGLVDLTLLRDHIEFRVAQREAEAHRLEEVAELLPFRAAIVELEEARWRLQQADGETAAALLAAIAEEIDTLDGRLERGRKRKGRGESSARTRPSEEADPEAADEEGVDAEAGDTAADESDALVTSAVLARRAARLTDGLRRALEDWFRYHDGYLPDFGWWVRSPYEDARKALLDHARLLRDKIAGGEKKDNAPLVGDPIGRDALVEALRHERIPYTPEELLAIGEREAAWCEAEMQRAAAEMGESDWRAALDRVKASHAPPGGQAELVARQALDAIAFIEERELVTIDPLCAETWRLEMISKQGQRTLPFAAYSGQKMLVAYPTEDMDHESKLMSMRGNNIHFSRIVTPHELIPGHHLQGYMAERHRAHRRLFRTPFLVEGWSLYWEMRLWELGYPQTPQDRIGMLFWRKHRTARIIVSLRFHLGEMSPQEMIDTLVDSVGMERDGATSEVRRYIGGSYGPLYQCAYMIGGLQLRALHRDLVGAGIMTNREFHDTVLRLGSIPIELIRAEMMNLPLTRDWRPSWKFHETLE